MLQNAIDAGERVKIDLSGDILTISNSGQPFKIENIKALMVPDNSTKVDLSDTIGCKGVGFRASLNISDDITIHSGDIHLCFNKSIANRMKEKYGLTKTPPMMRCPEEATNIFENDYTTNIIIKLRDEKQIGRIKNQIEDFGKESILFFNDSFKSLTISVDGTQNTYTRSRRILNNHEAIITLGHNDILTNMREFFMEGSLDNFEDEYDKKYRLSVVYSPEKIDHNKLYSFFHTEIDFPLDHWYAHGTFNLTNNRNQLVKNARNRILMELLMQLICSSATSISSDVDYTGYRILRSHGYFSDSILEDTDLNAMFEDFVGNALILPTVNNEYINLNSAPFFYDLNFQKYIQDMPENNKLLKYTKDEDVIYYLRQDINNVYDLELVSEYLNKYQFKDNEDLILCAKLLFKYYGDESDFLELAPSFFSDENGDKIKNGSILIPSEMSKSLMLPNFVNLKYIDKNLLQVAKKYLCVMDDYSFVSSDFAKAYGIKMADIDEILENIDKIIGEDSSYIADYVRWLFDNRETVKSSSYDKFFLLTKNNKIRRSDGVYFGKEYIKKNTARKIL